MSKELIEIQGELKVPKGQWNDFSKFNYRSCEDILKAVKPLMHERGCHLLMNDEMVAVGGRVYVKATVTFHTPKEKIEVTAFAREADNRKGMNADQLTGSTSSYARKYALNGLFCIDDSKDSDGNNGEGNDKPEEKPALDMSKIDVPGGLEFMKKKANSAMGAIKFFAETRTVSLEAEARIQEMWGE